MNYEETVEWIHGRLKFGIRPGLIRINEVLERLDNPQHKVRTIHIGGTNGKGSTTTFLRCLLEEAGLTVGTFTSPYIEQFSERIAINGQPIPDDDLVAVFNKVKPIIDEMDQDEELKNTVEFEILTAMMFQYFYEKKVDVVIVEVGLGGRFDSTNVIHPLVSAITTLGLDHIDILGDTIEEIAHQKAGIIKARTPIVVGKVEDSAFEVIRAEAEELGSPVYRYGEAFVSEYLQPVDTWGESFNFKSQELKLDHVTTSLLGRHQVDNASVAIQVYLIACEKLGLRVLPKHIKNGLKKAHWPGRMEKISDEPLIILDGAHNEHAMSVLKENLTKEFTGKTIHTIFAALSTKDIKGMLDDLKKVPNLNLRVTTFDYPKAFTKEQYEALDLEPYTHWQAALADTLNDWSGDDVILITGSLYFISQVREVLLGGTLIEEN
ncbi:bifunctional folylpolyglutamate synthase/dihydrofolate synthase [Vagococcus sp.]|uniref:bifunctional folylpolyglutamate synthase/dihydrofolate synthase n=1 Tax=Vagococcus sp. TaxID=1933889 RepID=UPI003F9CC198